MTTQRLAGSSARENPWLDAWRDPCGGLKVFSSHLALCDATGIGEHMLLVADISRNLKAYKNTDVFTTVPLLGIPTSIEVVWPDGGCIPALAIPSGRAIYFYRNFRPYYKYEIPPEDFCEEERAVWTDGWNENVPDLLLAVAEKQDISGRSRSLLSLSTLSEQEAFFQKMREVPLHQQSYCTCTTTIPIKAGESHFSKGSCLVFGTETKFVYIMEPEANTARAKISVPTVPTLLAVSGTLNVEYRVFVAGRGNVIYTIKNGQLLKQCTITVPATICELQVHLSNIYTACIDHRIYIHSFKGTVNGVLELPSVITAMAMFKHSTIQSKNVLLAGLKNGEIHMFVNKVHTHTLDIGDCIAAMKCGTYGRAESALVIITNRGNLNIKLLKRNYDFNSVKASDMYPIEQDMPIELPKISKLFLDQTQREKDNPTSMHKKFQGDILNLRVRVYHNYVKVLREGLGPVSHQGKFKLGVEVLGLGPTFKLQFELRNVSNRPTFDMSLVLCLDDENYYQIISNSIISIPSVVPELCYKYAATVRNSHPEGCGSPITCHLIDCLHTEPILSAIVEMPDVEVT